MVKVERRKILTEPEKKKCCDCKYFISVGLGVEGICQVGHGVVKQCDGGLPLAYNRFDSVACDYGIFGLSIEERLARLEDRLDNLETSKKTKAEWLVETYKYIVTHYTPEEVDQVIVRVNREVGVRMTPVDEANKIFQKGGPEDGTVWCNR